jgi:hypothetical protein
MMSATPSVRSIAVNQGVYNIREAYSGKRVEAIAADALGALTRDVPLSLRERATALAIGVLLLVPIVNAVAMLILMDMHSNHLKLDGLDVKARALLRLYQLEVMGRAAVITDNFEPNAAMLQFDLDAALQKYPVDKEPRELCKLFGWAGIDAETLHTSFFDAVGLKKYEDQRDTAQYVKAKDQLSRLNSYFVQKRKQVERGTQAETRLIEQFKKSVDKIIDADRGCIDQVLSQLQEIMLDIAADDFGDGEQGSMLLRAGHELCKYRMDLLKEICIRQNPAQDHMADLQLLIVEKAAEALGIQGSIARVGAQFNNLVGDEEYRDNRVNRAADIFWDRYKPLEYLAEQLKTGDGNMNALRNELNQWAKAHYGIDEEETVLNARLVKNYNPKEFSDFVNGAEWTPAATFLILEAAGLASAKPTTGIRPYSSYFRAYFSYLLRA